MMRVHGEDVLAQHQPPHLRRQDWQPRQVVHENDEPDQSKERAFAVFFDPHGNHVETVSGTCEHVGREAGGYLARMAADGYPCSVIIEPETTTL